MKIHQILAIVLSAKLVASIAAATLPAVKVPLCPGLTVVTAVTQPEGDYESIKLITSVSDGTVQLNYSSELPVAGAPGNPMTIQKLRMRRTIRETDLVSARLYLQEYQTNVPSEVPGTTALGVSSAVLAALKTRGEAELGVFQLPAPAPGSAKIPSDQKQHPNVFDYYEIYKLRRVENGPVMLPVIVNDVRTELPAIHATGRSDYYGYKGEFFFLDDESNPLALKWRLGIGGRVAGPSAGGDRDTLEVVRITYNCSPSGSTSNSAIARLERALADAGHADIYDIYFSFNSDEIREESEPTMREIGEILRRHPDWKLRIGGHTDGIGGDASNLDLSKRRAAAVKNALVARFDANAGRLATTGYGKSRPVDTNETPEGRARNRRVELVRQS
jgi:outer membrane protein OmpA-like peptidoglycan-associated protein